MATVKKSMTTIETNTPNDYERFIEKATKQLIHVVPLGDPMSFASRIDAAIYFVSTTLDALIEVRALTVDMVICVISNQQTWNRVTGVMDTLEGYGNPTCLEISNQLSDDFVFITTRPEMNPKVLSGRDKN